MKARKDRKSRVQERADTLLSHAGLLLCASRRNHQHRVPLAESFYTEQNFKMLTELIIASITNLN